MPFTVRDAATEDAESIVALIAILAGEWDEELELSAVYVHHYLSFPGTHVLLAEPAGQAEAIHPAPPIGLLSYTLHPNLFHGGDTGMIEQLVVAPSARRQGVATALLEEAVRRMHVAGCVELSVSTGKENDVAQRLYRRFGLTEESLLLERHLPRRRT